MVTVTPADLSLLSSGGAPAQWLAAVSLGWMRFWQDQLGTDGFHPFDSLAVGYVIDPLNFACEQIPARVQRMRSLFVARDALEVSHTFERSTSVTYCSEVDRGVEIRGLPITLSKTPGRVETLGPELGQDTELILMDILEMEWDRIEALKAQGVIP